MADNVERPVHILPPKILHTIVYHLYLLCVHDKSLDAHFCSLNDPCQIALLALSPLFSARMVSSAWNDAILAISTLKDHVFFQRVDDAYYPHAWHINTKIRQAVLLKRYRVYRTISTEIGDRGVYEAYDFGHASGCVGTERVIVKAWLSASDPECAAESQAYKIFDASPVAGVPEIYAGLYDDKTQVFALVLQRLGPSLQEVRDALLPHCRFDDRMVLSVAIQMLDRCKDIHARGIIHNGIKPGNICIPPSDSEGRSQLYAIDYGYSFQLDVADTARLPSAHRADTVGNRNFLSALSHHGITHSQRDDLESLAYLLSFLRHGDLPWTFTTRKSRFRAIENQTIPQLWRLKMATPASVIFRDMDQAFVDFWKDLKGLAFGEVPDYDSMRRRFEDSWRRNGFGDVPGQLDWWEISHRAGKDI